MHLEQTSSKEIHSFIWSKHKNSKSHTVLAGATPLFGDRFSKRSRHQQSWSLLPVRIINTLGHSPFRQKQTTVLEEVAPPSRCRYHISRRPTLPPEPEVSSRWVALTTEDCCLHTPSNVASSGEEKSKCASFTSCPKHLL